MDRETTDVRAVESQLVEHWKDAIGVSAVRTDESFSDIGDSLCAAICLLSIREAFGVECSAEELTAPGVTLADVANTIVQKLSARSVGTPRLQ